MFSYFFLATGGGVINVLVLEILPYVFLLHNEAKHAQNTKHVKNRIRSESLDLNACPRKGEAMVTAAACPQDENPLSYARLTGEWAIWSEIAHRFERKVPTQDRGDIRHTIILELALARARDGNKPFGEALMCRIASFVVADYWRKAKRKPTILSLDSDIEDGDGGTTELAETIADDAAIDMDAWVDARTFLLGCPRRLVQIAFKRLNRVPLDNADRLYLSKWRKREQKRLLDRTHSHLS